MKIALINENSQAAKNALIAATLAKVVEPLGHQVFNYGMYTTEDQATLTYVQNGILAAILLNSRAADYVVTGCGTGAGAMLARSEVAVGSSANAALASNKEPTRPVVTYFANIRDLPHQWFGDKENPSIDSPFRVPLAFSKLHARTRSKFQGTATTFREH